MATINCKLGSNQDLEYYQNDVLPLILTVTEDDEVTPVDFSGKDLLMQIKTYRSDSSSLAELESGDEITISGANNDVLTLSGTYDIESGTYYYDLRNTTDSKTVIYGLFIVTGDVSK